MQKRPQIRQELKISDKVIILLTWVVVILSFVLVFQYFKTLPDTIPTHYGPTGEADGWGDKAALWSLPIISLVLVVMMQSLSFYPQHLNYPFTITELNVNFQYRLASRFIRFLGLIIALIFGYILYHTIQVSLGTSDESLPQWSVIVMLFLFFVPMLVYFVLASRGNE